MNSKGHVLAAGAALDFFTPAPFYALTTIKYEPRISYSYTTHQSCVTHISMADPFADFGSGGTAEPSFPDDPFAAFEASDAPHSKTVHDGDAEGAAAHSAATPAVDEWPGDADAGLTAAPAPASLDNAFVIDDDATSDGAVPPAASAGDSAPFSEPLAITHAEAADGPSVSEADEMSTAAVALTKPNHPTPTAELVSLVGPIGTFRGSAAAGHELVSGFGHPHRAILSSSASQDSDESMLVGTAMKSDTESSPPGSSFSSDDLSRTEPIPAPPLPPTPFSVFSSPPLLSVVPAATAAGCGAGGSTASGDRGDGGVAVMTQLLHGGGSSSASASSSLQFSVSVSTAAAATDGGAIVDRGTHVGSAGKLRKDPAAAAAAAAAASLAPSTANTTAASAPPAIGVTKTDVTDDNNMGMGTSSTTPGARAAAAPPAAAATASSKALQQQESGEDTAGASTSAATVGASSAVLDGGLSLPPLPSISAPGGAPTLVSATINSITVTWPLVPGASGEHQLCPIINSLTVTLPLVPGASGYYVDYEFRGRERDVLIALAHASTDSLPSTRSNDGRTPPSSVLLEGTPSSGTVSGVSGPDWTGTGGRVVVNGSSLLTGLAPSSTSTAPRARITGLQKDANYAVRVTAVRIRRVALPDGQVLTQTQESHPSAVSAPLRTLGAAEEIVRLAAHNNALIVENLRIPVLEAQIGDLEEAREAQVSALSHALHDTETQLAAALAEVSRLLGELQARTTELSEALTQGAKARDDAHAATARADRLDAELRAANESIASLEAGVRERDAALAQAAEAADASATKAAAQEHAFSEQSNILAETSGKLSEREARIKGLQTELETAQRRLSLLSGDKEVLVQKLADDLAKIMDEMDNVQDQLHKAQDYVQYLEPPAKLIIDIREKQAIWDRQHKLIEEQHAGAIQRMSAQRKLGPRPKLEL